MQQEQGFIKYIVILGVILGVAFLSQQPYFKELSKGVLSDQSSGIQDYWAKGSNWVKESAYLTVTGEVQKRGDIIKNEVNQEKENISQNIGEKIQNYFSGIVDSVIHPGTNASGTQTCQPAETSTVQ